MEEPEDVIEKHVLERVCEIVPAHLRKLCGLYTLALDQRRSSSAYDDELWCKVHPELWFKLRNPWLILQMLSQDRLEILANDKAFMQLYDDHFTSYFVMKETKGWFAETYKNSPLKHIAYFSLEFGLSEALPIYSGGLGILAGDHLKTATDLDVPITGIGLLYQVGYFRQYFDADGNQVEAYPYNDPSQLPILRSRNKKGEFLRIEIEFPGRIIYLKVWEVRIGKIKLYLLDSNDPINTPFDRGIVGSLYGGNSEHRLQQEYILGIGGWKLLQALEIDPQVCHLNEGHAAFAVLARAKSYMEANGVSFDKALTITRSGNLFTTHTPVSAGFDQFAPELIVKYFGNYISSVKITMNDLMALGRENAFDSNELFNMAFLAFRGSGAVNGVSKLHGEVSRKLFAPLFPRWPLEEIPVGYVTNGVHIPSWESPAADTFWSKASGKQRRWWANPEGLKDDFKSITDEEIWKLRSESRTNMIKYLRFRFSYQKRVLGSLECDVKDAEKVFDPNVLTLGFARRFATYKRATLLLKDQERLIRLISNTNRPVQIVIAGKAHPKDQEGKALIEQWQNFIKRPEVCSRVIFLADYDILMAERLVQGVDVWINTPERPWEASGTSGMKLLANGGLNLSELDGWWAEAYTPDVGWALGDGKEHNWDPVWEQSEAESLYSILEQKVVPLFYERDGKDLPREWLRMIRESMINLAPQYSTIRMMKEYVVNYYLPAATAFVQRADNHGALGVRLQDWFEHLRVHWNDARFVGLDVTKKGNDYLFQVKVRLGALRNEDVKVELYANPLNGEAPLHLEMASQGNQGESEGIYLYTAQVPGNRAASDYTPRIVPDHRSELVPTEVGEILWKN